MERKKAVSMYLFGALGQMLIVCIAVRVLRSFGIKSDYTTLIGMVAIVVGGVSSALWWSRGDWLAIHFPTHFRGKSKFYLFNSYYICFMGNMAFLIFLYRRYNISNSSGSIFIWFVDKLLYFSIFIQSNSKFMDMCNE
jgi:hypothetical protein